MIDAETRAYRSDGDELFRIRPDTASMEPGISASSSSVIPAKATLRNIRSDLALFDPRAAR